MSGTLSRRAFVAGAAAGVAGAWLGEGRVLAAPRSVGRRRQGADLQWFDVADWGVEGTGWADAPTAYDRLPSRAQQLVRPPVWRLGRNSAGLCARFETDAPEVHVRYALRSSQLALPHMPATGVSGADLYAAGADGTWHWAGVARPTAREVEARLVAGLVGGTRRYALYLPLYNGVTGLAVGVPAGTSFRPVAPRRDRAIVYYGTSIAQGACASRPGLAFTAILGRRLDLPVINLGFSGNGHLEGELALLLAELDPAVYVIDCLPNLTAAQVSERAEPFVHTLRASRPGTPILLVEDRSFGNATLVPGLESDSRALRAALRRAYERLAGAGVPALHYVTGTPLLGADGEATTDGSHPNDLGMMRYAAALEPALRRALAPA